MCSLLLWYIYDYQWLYLHTVSLSMVVYGIYPTSTCLPLYRRRSSLKVVDFHMSITRINGLVWENLLLVGRAGRTWQGITIIGCICFCAILTTIPRAPLYCNNYEYVIMCIYICVCVYMYICIYIYIEYPPRPSWAKSCWGPTHWCLEGATFSDTSKTSQHIISIWIHIHI